MPGPLVLSTARLRLVAPTAELERLAREPLRLARALDAELPSDWPPPVSADVQGFWAEALEQEPALQGWTAWYWLFCEPGDPPRLVGHGGFTGAPREGQVELGYAVVDSHHRRGIATEACTALVVWASRDARVRRIVAHTYPELTPSRRVLDRLGFVETGPGAQERTLRYELALG